MRPQFSVVSRLSARSRRTQGGSVRTRRDGARCRHYKYSFKSSARRGQCPSLFCNAAVIHVRLRAVRTQFIQTSRSVSCRSGARCRSMNDSSDDDSSSPASSRRRMSSRAKYSDASSAHCSAILKATTLIGALYWPVIRSEMTVSGSAVRDRSQDRRDPSDWNRRARDKAPDRNRSAQSKGSSFHAYATRTQLAAAFNHRSRKRSCAEINFRPNLAKTDGGWRFSDTQGAF
jgi:hypothetical protein